MRWLHRAADVVLGVIAVVALIGVVLCRRGTETGRAEKRAEARRE